jgi:hypothetical protein
MGSSTTTAQYKTQPGWTGKTVFHRGFRRAFADARLRAARMRRIYPDRFSTNPFKQEYTRGGPETAGAHKGMP